MIAMKMIASIRNIAVSTVFAIFTIGVASPIYADSAAVSSFNRGSSRFYTTIQRLASAENETELTEKTKTSIATDDGKSKKTAKVKNSVLFVATAAVVNAVTSPLVTAGATITGLSGIVASGATAANPVVLTTGAVIAVSYVCHQVSKKSQVQQEQ